MTIKYYNDLIQGSDEWHAARCGLLTASEMKLIITPAKLDYAKNEKARTHLFELAAQRIGNYTEPTYIGDEMLRGHEDEIYARAIYSEKYEHVTECGFVTNDKWGFTIGCSPDGLVRDDGMIEIKSRRQKFQVKAIIEDCVDSDYMLQTQTLLLVTERKWIDFISYCGGLPMFVKRIYPDLAVHEAIIKAASLFHGEMNIAIETYNKNAVKFHPTERMTELEITSSED